jgi:hypothetical protein
MPLSVNRETFTFNHTGQVDEYGASVGDIATVQGNFDSRAEQNLTDINNIKDYIIGELVPDINSKDTAQTEALNTHKSSGDHDGRYYQKTEVDDKDNVIYYELDGKITTHQSSGDHDGRYFTKAELSSTVNESSGADLIGATAISGVTGETVQIILESLKNNTSLVNESLALHKLGSSTDHDSRYIRLTADQTIAGVKTFSSSPIVPTPTTTTQAANKGYVDGVALAAVANDSLTELKMAAEMKKQAGGVAEYNTVATHLAEAVSYVLTVTRDISLTGVQTITLPFLAKSIRVIAVVPTTKATSEGFWSQSGVQNGMHQIADTSSYNPLNSYAIVMRPDASNYSYGAIQNVIATGFEILWAKAGTPTGTATIIIQANTH